MRRVSTPDLVPALGGEGERPTGAQLLWNTSLSLLPPLLPALVSVTHGAGQAWAAMAAALIWIPLLAGKLGPSSGRGLG